MNNKALDVAHYWSPSEATAILEYLDRLRDLVWELYSEEIIELRQEDHGEEPVGETDSDGVSETQRIFVFDSDINQ